MVLKMELEFGEGQPKVELHVLPVPYLILHASANSADAIEIEAPVAILLSIPACSLHKRGHNVDLEKREELTM